MKQYNLKELKSLKKGSLLLVDYKGYVYEYKGIGKIVRRDQYYTRIEFLNGKEINKEKIKMNYWYIDNHKNYTKQFKLFEYLRLNKYQLISQ